jgi:tRNA threonylcarbamoyladenosine biosynthesis protein TsaE
MGKSCIVELPDEQATASLGARLAGLLRAGDAILLAGPIGAGKSTLARALLREAAGDPTLDVPSPTFTLVQSYDLPRGRRLHHFDLWRLDGPSGLAELGWDDAVHDIVLVEWPERLHTHPDHALQVDLMPVTDTARRATLTGWADRWQRP